MAIWDRLLRKIINPIVNESIAEISKKEASEKGLMAQPINFGLPIIPGAGAIISRSFPKGISYKTLREFSVLYPVLRSCISYRKRQITQLAWDVTPVEVITDKKLKEQYQEDAARTKEFLKYPTGDKSMTFRTFIDKILEDLLILDAVAIYRRRNRKGGLYGYLPIDASTIKLILNADGTTPVPPEEAYLQEIDGVETARFTIDELIYKVMNPRTDSPYGLSPVETLILVVTTALKLSAYDLAYLTEGNIPEGLVELPKDIASNPDQLKAWQEAWDAMFSGDPRFQRKIKFLPEGMKWHPIRKPEDMAFDKFEKWLLLQTCFDDKTEILTENGWKFFKDLQGEKVATRNKDGFIEFQKPTRYQSYFYDGPMVSFKGKMIDLLVTPDHRMLTTYNHGKKRGLSPFKFEKARDLVNKEGHFAPLTALWAGLSKTSFSLPGLDLRISNINGTEKIKRCKEVKINSKDWFRFFGLWLADGWARGSKGGQKPGYKGNNKSLGYTVGISTKTPAKQKIVLEILEKLPFNWRKDGGSFITNNIQLWNYLSGLGNVYTKRIPRHYFNYDTECLQALWEGYLLGDGYKKGNYEMAVSVNKGLLDDFQEILFRLGKNSSITKKPPGESVIEGRKVKFDGGFILTVRRSNFARLKGKISYYSGIVYDVTVPNGTIFVRRNGKCVWTGNCSVMEVPPQAIGFQFERGKGATETEWEIGKERGLFPLANFLKELFDQIIQEDLGQKHLEFVWTNINPTNKKEEAEVFNTLVRTGAVSVDEWRLGEGLNPIGCPHYIMTPVGPIFVKDLVSQSEEGQKPYLPYKPTPQTPQTIQQKIKQATRNEIIQELKRWKKVISNDLKQGKSFRDFKTDIIDFRTQKLIKDGLKSVKTKEDLDQLFDPFISQENQIISAMLDLYDEVSAITNYGSYESYESTGIEKNPESA